MAKEGNVSHNVSYPAQDTVDTILMQIALVCTWVLYNVICQIVNIFGIGTNIINIVCFVKQGFKDSINVSLLGLSVSDLGSLITMCWSCISLTFNAANADLPFESIEVMYLVSVMPHFAFIRVSICITAMITLERCLSIAEPLKVRHIAAPKRVGLIIVCIFAIFTFTSSPLYVVNRLGPTFSALRNKTIVGLISREDKEQVEMFTFAINNFFFPVCIFVILAVSAAILSIQLRKQSKWRQTTFTDAHADKITNRNLNVAKMVVSISTLFIICYFPCPIIMLAISLEPELSIHGKYVDVSIILGGLMNIMESVNASTNIFIYRHMSFKYRETLRKLFGFGRGEKCAR